MRDLAQSGHTQELLILLEDGAPFVVDMVGSLATVIKETGDIKESFSPGRQAKLSF